MGAGTSPLGDRAGDNHPGIRSVHALIGAHGDGPSGAVEVSSLHRIINEFIAELPPARKARGQHEA